MDLDPETTFVTADTHFGHDNIIRFCSRPVDHETIIIEHWNEMVPPGGHVLHLGDLAYRDCAHFEQNIAPFLNGTKKLILGNHDKQKPAFYGRCGFEIIEPFSMFWNGQVVSFGHYPLEATSDSITHIHGHIHNNGYGPRGVYMPYRANQVNVSTEQTQYRPVLLGDLLRGVFG